MEAVGGRASLGGHKQSSYGCTNYLLDLMALMALYRSNTLSDDNDKQGTITKTQTDAQKRTRRDASTANHFVTTITRSHHQWRLRRSQR